MVYVALCIAAMACATARNSRLAWFILSASWASFVFNADSNSSASLVVACFPVFLAILLRNRTT